MKKLSVKSVVAIGIGAALFFVLGKVSIPTPVPNTYISLQYAIQAVFATLFGPIAGLLIGFIGHALIDMTSYGPWWSWIIASGLSALITGLCAKKIAPQVEDGKFSSKEAGTFVLYTVIAHAVSCIVVAPVLDIVIYGESAKLVFAQGAIAFVTDAITAAVVGLLLLKAYSATKVSKGSLAKNK